nr:hypothetical protein [uncultured Pedobacter sp.]
MRKKASYFALSVAIFLAGCGSSNQNNTSGSVDSSSLIANSNVSQDIILRDSIVLLKYKNQKDTIAFPVINPQFPQLAKALQPEAILGQKLSEIKESYENCGCGYTSLSYQKSFSNSKIISLWFHTAFVGPYPSETTIYQTLTLNTGKAYHLTDQLNEAGQQFVLTKYKDSVLRRLESDKVNHTEADYSAAYNQIKDNITQLRFDAINDNYLVKDSTILVKTETVLPHAILAWEIDRALSFSLDELKQFKKSNASF